MVEQDLPPVVARMWGRETSARHGPRPSLETATVVDAAVSLADEGGLAGVTMSRVASRLGVAAMSLYRYVGSKEELLTMMADAAAPEPPSPGMQGWRDYAFSWTRAQRDYLLARPWVLEIPRSGPPLGPRELRWLEAMLAALEETRLGLGERINVATVLSGYALAQADLARHLAPPGEDGSRASESRTRYTAVLSEVLDAGAYPQLSSITRLGGFGDAAEWVDDADFAFGLNLLCAGIDALIAHPPGEASTDRSA